MKFRFTYESIYMKTWTVYIKYLINRINMTSLNIKCFCYCSSINFPYGLLQIFQNLTVPFNYVNIERYLINVDAFAQFLEGSLQCWSIFFYFVLIGVVNLSRIYYHVETIKDHKAI